MRSPIDGPVSRGNSISSQSECRRVHVSSTTPGHPSSCRLSPHPFSRSAGCEPNRASHPSGSSLSRCAATALAALAAPEKRWCQAVSKGLVTFLWLSRWRRQSATGSRLGRFSHLHSIGWHKDGVQSFEVVVHQTAILAHRLWPSHYTKQRCTSKGFCSRSMW
jgi:hypothetical protein